MVSVLRFPFFTIFYVLLREVHSYITLSSKEIIYDKENKLEQILFSMHNDKIIFPCVHIIQINGLHHCHPNSLNSFSPEQLLKRIVFVFILRCGSGLSLTPLQIPYLLLSVMVTILKTLPFLIL